MKVPLQVGVTGGIGSGKSLVCKIFQTLGVWVYDADGAAKKLMTTNKWLVQQIKKEFGEASYFPDGTLNRHYLAKTVFGEKETVKKLNNLVHPQVGIDYEYWADLHRDQTYVIREAALLFEAGTSADLDNIIVVSAPEALRIKRVLKRDPHRSEADIRNIMLNQMPEEEKIARADSVIVNDEQRLIIPQVLALHERFSAHV